jgi:hypothetical protein
VNIWNWLVENKEIVIAVVAFLAGLGVAFFRGKAKDYIVLVIKALYALGEDQVDNVSEAEVRAVATLIYVSYVPALAKAFLSETAFCDLAWKLWDMFRDAIDDDVVHDVRVAARSVR